MYADDFVGHKTAAANIYRIPKTPLERLSVEDADRVGDGMVVGVKSVCREWMEVSSSCVVLNFVSLCFESLLCTQNKLRRSQRREMGNENVKEQLKKQTDGCSHRLRPEK
jgi:hypothetical protein